MTKLLWDQVGSRSYETGLSQGVLYLSDGSAVPWNGLKSVDETLADEVSNPFFFDGMKFAEGQSYGDFSATLTAFTYPDEFTEFDGVSSLGGGIFVDAQSPKRFGLSYRTEVSDDLNGTGYRIHVVYNVMAVSSDRSYSSITDTTTPSNFSWSLTAVPSAIIGFRPTAHFIIDSRFTKSYILNLVESTLYGSTTANPSLPAPQDLINLITGYNVITVVDNGDDTLTITGPDNLVYATADATVWQIDQANVAVIDADTYLLSDTKDV